MKTVPVSNDIYREFMMYRKVMKELLRVHKKLDTVYGTMERNETAHVSIRTNDKYPEQPYMNLNVFHTILFIERLLEGQTEMGLGVLREMLGQ